MGGGGPFLGELRVGRVFRVLGCLTGGLAGYGRRADPGTSSLRTPTSSLPNRNTPASRPTRGGAKQVRLPRHPGRGKRNNRRSRDLKSANGKRGRGRRGAERVGGAPPSPLSNSPRPRVAAVRAPERAARPYKESTARRAFHCTEGAPWAVPCACAVRATPRPLPRRSSAGRPGPASAPRPRPALSRRSALQQPARPPAACSAGSARMPAARRSRSSSRRWPRGCGNYTRRSCCPWRSTTASTSSTRPRWRTLTSTTSLWCSSWASTARARPPSSGT